MQTIDSYHRWRAANKSAAAALDGFAEAAAGSGFRTTILWGSVVLGDFQPRVSDVDLLLVFSGGEHPECAPLKDCLAACASYRFDVLSIAECALEMPHPVAVRSLDPASRYEVHGLDLIQLKHYSKLIRGPDIRKGIRELEVATEVRKALDHVLNEMVPRSLQAARAAGRGTIAGTPLVNVANVMARCIYALYEGRLASKSSALKWAADRFAADQRGPGSSSLFRLLLEYRLGGDETLLMFAGGIELFEAMLPRYREEIASKLDLR